MSYRIYSNYSTIQIGKDELFNENFQFLRKPFEISSSKNTTVILFNYKINQLVDDVSRNTFSDNKIYLPNIKIESTETYDLDYLVK